MERLDLVESIVSCTGCELAEKCSGPVAFTGPTPATIAVVGEAPGAQEDTAGKPFIGPAGDMIRKHLRAADIDPDQCFIMNTVSCWPHGTPTQEHVDACNGNRKAQLTLADPTWVLLLGSVALRAVKPGLVISKARGRPFRPEPSGPVYLATMHPAAALRKGEYQDAMREDLVAFSKMVAEGIQGWRNHISQTCWECGSEDVVWFMDDYSCWCSKHAPPAYRDRLDLLDLAWRAAKERLSKPEQRDMFKPDIDRNVAPLGNLHPDTAAAAADRVFPRSGSRRRKIYDLILAQGGATDDEIEVHLGLSHQSASASRNTLMNDGWLADSGVRRKTRYGNDAIVWKATP